MNTYKFSVVIEKDSDGYFVLCSELTIDMLNYKLSRYRRGYYV